MSNTYHGTKRMRFYAIGLWKKIWYVAKLSMTLTGFECSLSRSRACLHIHTLITLSDEFTRLAIAVVRAGAGALPAIRPRLFPGLLFSGYHLPDL